MDIEKLISLMKYNNFTMYRLSKLSGVPESSVNRIVHGQSPDSNVSTVKKLAKALGVKVDDLLSD